jgi:hypothetical protein
MIVIADTTPVNYLVLIDAADLLPRLFGQVLKLFHTLSEADSVINSLNSERRQKIGWRIMSASRIKVF